MKEILRMKLRAIGARAATAAFLACLLAVASPVSAGPKHKGLRVDVAMIGQTFFDFEENPDPDREGIPPDGSPFIIEGYVYRDGTFDRYGPLSGVNADGSAEFPDRVIGKWICRGWHLQDGDAETGIVVATTQIFDFDLDRPGRHTIVTDGIELADFNVTFHRAVTGGSGVFNRVGGEHAQVYHAVGEEFLNASGGFNTSFAFDLQQASRHFPLYFFK